jgi:hypothetical protein
MNWDEVQHRLRAGHELAGEGTAWLAVLRRTSLGGDEPAVQPVLVELVMAHGAPWLMATADVVPEPLIDPRAALAHNRRPAIGALAMDGGMCVYRAVFPLESLGPALLERIIDAVAREAVLVRRAASGGAVPAARVVVAD